MLLARIGVLTTGILVAFAASGIPLDKIAIIIGALGVGIGFGLQNIVGNLVSGIILAFEKPVQIGDVIEVGPHSGTVKEIGFRSSKITTADGAEVIVPNSDLISQHVTNWTMTNNFRRVEVNVGVAYGSDLSMCREAIAKAVFKKNNILSIPEPLILVNELAGSSINFRILFWANDIGNWVLTKSQVLDEVYANLNQAGIRIPFPQQDLHIKSVDDEVLSALKRDGRVAADEESV
jgi:small-conductance mechanosensitive channel